MQIRKYLKALAYSTLVAANLSYSGCYSEKQILDAAFPPRPEEVITQEWEKNKFLEIAPDEYIAYRYKPGKLPAFLLIHGMGGYKDQMREFEELFQNNGYATLNMDLPGHGNSSYSVPPSNPINHIGDIAKLVIETEGFQEKDAVVVGFSAGGMAAIENSIEHDPKAAIIISAAPEAVLPFYFIPLLNWQKNSEASKIVSERYASFEWLSAIWNDALQYEGPPLSEYDTTTLMYRGTKDKKFPLEKFLMLQNPAPNYVTRIDFIGNHPLPATHQEELKKSISEWLTQDGIPMQYQNN